MWPEKKKDLTIEEINDELRRAGNLSQRKGEDLTPITDELVRALEGEDTNSSEKISSYEDTKRKISVILEKLIRQEKENRDKEKS